MKDFLEHIQEFFVYLEALKSITPRNVQKLIELNKSEPLPKEAIYVFYEGKTPLYVGRTNRLISRLQEHGAKYSTHYSASFAFLLAKV